jgi:hypothetical protein
MSTDTLMICCAPIAVMPLSCDSSSASSSARRLMMSAARKSTSARCAAGSLRHTPDSKVSRARATAPSTVA